MNSIVRIILRGLLSGEIRPEPQVFERLREFSEGQYQRHSRILRLVPPSGVGAGLPDGQPMSQISSAGGFPRGPGSRTVPFAPASRSLRREWPTFASVSCGRWLRLSAGLLAGGLLLVLGVATVQAAVQSEVAATWTPVSAEAHPTRFAPAQTYGAMTAVLGVVNPAPPFPNLLLFASGTLLGGFLLRAGWRWFCRKQLFVMRPYEVALQELEATRFRAEHGAAADSRRAVLDILREYLQAQFGLRIPRMEGGEFPTALTPGAAPMTFQQRSLLKEVLRCSEETARVGCPQCAELCEKAVRFVWATACCRPARRSGNQIPTCVR